MLSYALRKGCGVGIRVLNSTDKQFILISWIWI